MHNKNSYKVLLQHLIHNIFLFGMISGQNLLKTVRKTKHKKPQENESEEQCYICTSKDCYKVLKTKNTFQHHIKICRALLLAKNQTISKAIYSCIICNYTTNNSGNLFVHHRKHTKIRPYHCKLCTQTYGHRTNLRNHIISTHWKFKQFSCPICNLSFTLKSYMKQHLLKHTGKYSYFNVLYSYKEREKKKSMV